MASFVHSDGAGDFSRPMDDKFCDSYLGYAKIVQVYLDTTFQTPIVHKKLHHVGDDIDEAFRLIYDLPVLQNIIITRSPMLKNTYDARQLNIEGDTLMFTKKYKEALVKFNGSVLMGLPGTRELAEGYAGRGRALFHLQDFNGALENLDAAFAVFPCVDDQCGNLMRLRVQAQEMLARDVMEMAPKVSDPPPSGPVSQEGYVTATSVYFPPSMRQPGVQHDWRLKPSDKGQIRRDAERGRHFVATGELFPGDVIVDEEPVSIILYTRNWEDHCQRCVMRTSRPIPCPKCSAVAYCTEFCRQVDLDIHQFECGMARNLHGVTPGEFNIHMIYRLICRVPLTTMVYAPWKRKMQSQDPIKVITGEPNLHPDLAMLMHFKALSLGRRHLDDCRVFLDYMVRANYILGLLVREKPNEYAALNRTEILYIGSMMARMLIASENNYYSYDSVPILATGEVDSKATVGAAISAALSFVNHACLPNACVAWGKGRAKLIALRTIRKGEEITVSYCGINLNVPKSRRQRDLSSQWGFMQVLCQRTRVCLSNR